MFVVGTPRALTKRGISQATCEFFSYGIGEFKGKPVQVADYKDKDGNVVAQKVRFADKAFTFLGEPKIAPLYGQHLWREGGKRLVITEGEIDALSYAEASNRKWPVVSVQNGAQGAARSIKAALEWVSAYDEVVIWFDMDEPGRKAATEVASLLPPGKAKIVSTQGYKDCNEMLQAGKTKDIMVAVWEARPFRPDGIVSGGELTLADIQKKAAMGYSLPYPGLNEKLHGLRKGELTLLTAGSGIGKSTLAREIAFHLHQEHGCTIGNIFLEESVEKTVQGYVAIDNNVPLGSLRENPGILTDAQWSASYEKVVKTRQWFHRHFGSLESARLLDKMRYMVVALGVDFIILDHISIVISGMEASQEGERRDIDKLMTRLRALVEETGVGVIAIVHLNQPDGRAHEEGARVSLNNLRGSGALKQLSDNVVALERDQQGDEPDVSLARVLKNREFGDLGPADYLRYNRETGRLELDLGAHDDVGF